MIGIYFVTITTMIKAVNNFAC